MRKIGSTESKCFQEKVVKCVIFDSFLSLTLRGQVPTGLKTVKFRNTLVIGDFGKCSFSGMLETEEQIKLD